MNDLEKFFALPSPKLAGVGGDTAGDSHDATVVVESEESPSEEPASRGTDAAKDLSESFLTRPDAHPVGLNILFMRKYGVEFLRWEPETIRRYCLKDFGGISHANLEKLQASKTLLLVDTYWQRWETFVWCTMAFAGSKPDLEVMQVPTLEQAILSVRYAKLHREDTEWSEEVKLYLRTLFTHDHVFYLPQILDFVPMDPVLHGLPLQARAQELKYSSSDPASEQLRRLGVLQDLLVADDKLLRDQLRVVQSLS